MLVAKLRVVSLTDVVENECVCCNENEIACFSGTSAVDLLR